MSDDPDELMLVTTSFDDAAEAKALARALVERGLAACAQLHAVQSTYLWQGAVEEADELLLTVKTTRAALPALERFVGEAHSYDVPELVAVPIAWASRAYGDWVRENVGKPDERT